MTGVSVVAVIAGHRAARGPWCPLVFLVLLFPPVLVRPSKYLGIRPRPRERLGYTKPGQLLGHGGGFQGDGIAWTPVWIGVGGEGDDGREGRAHNRLTLTWHHCVTIAVDDQCRATMQAADSTGSRSLGNVREWRQVKR